MRLRGPKAGSSDPLLLDVYYILYRFRYADGECSVMIEESVMGKDVFVVSPTHSNDSLVEMLLVIGAARR